MNSTAEKTWRVILGTGREILTHAGVKNAETDARWLLAGALGIERDRLTTVLPDTAKPQVLARYDSFLQRRCEHEPVAQILGVREFFGHPFRISRDVLDPRPETELLVQIALEEKANSVLDLGTGSGCILLSILAAMPEATGVGSDLSRTALDIATVNSVNLKLEKRSTFTQSNWFGGINGKFDLIVSNPPYISDGEMDELAPDVRNWEPRIALTSGGDGSESYREITADVAEHLNSTGRLIVEIGPSQGADVEKMFNDAGLVDVTIRKDLDGRDRAVIGRRIADNG